MKCLQLSSKLVRPNAAVQIRATQNTALRTQSPFTFSRQFSSVIIKRGERLYAASEPVEEEPVVGEEEQTEVVEEAPAAEEEASAVMAAEASAAPEEEAAESTEPAPAAPAPSPTPSAAPGLVAPGFTLNFLYLDRNIAIAVDHVFARGSRSPATEYFFWPRNDAWEQLKTCLENKPWISERDKVLLLNKTTEVINFWQDEENKHTIDDAREAFPDCMFSGV